MTASLDKDIQLLEQQFTLQGIRFKQHNELIAVHIENSAATATIFLQGAQLSHFQPLGKEPIIWLSKECDYKEGKPLRGGVPICWPWFGDLDKNPDVIQTQFSQLSPTAHGLVRDKLWTLESIQHLNNSTTELLLSFEFKEGGFNIKLELQCLIAESLTLKLRTQNLMTTAFHYSAALHTYFSINDINSVSVKGLENKPYVDSLRDWQPFNDSSPLTFQQEVDRIYSDVTQPIEIIDASTKRTLLLKQDNAENLVAWNPWIEKSKRLSNFSATDYQSMLCLETAQVLTSHKTLKPNDSDTIQLSIS